MEQPSTTRPDTIASFVVRRPRLAGLMFLALALVGVYLNLTLLRSAGIYFPSALVGLGGVSAFFLWVIVTGRTATVGAPKPPRWWTVGAVFCALVGAGLGAYVVAMLRN